MNVVAIGPLVFAPDRFAAIVAIAAFLLVGEVLSRKVNSRFSSWSWGAAMAFVVGARLGHVLEHAGSFVTDPLRVLYIWQGGFMIAAGVALAVVYTVWTFRRQFRLFLWSALPGAAAGYVAVAVLALTAGAPPLPLPSGDTYSTLAGAPFDPQKLAGKPVVLNLWASWCPPCRREMPMMAEVAAAVDHADIVFVNQGESAETIGHYLAEERLEIENVVLDPLGQFARHYEALGLPATLFISSDGQLHSVHMGEISPEALIEGMAELRSP
jgi:Thiol-disulfide isomerase and thioredoxins